MMKYITVDVRMICSSGIGTVIQNILERVIPQCTECFFYLIGKTDDLKKFKFSYFLNVSCISCNAPIYSIQEQWEMMRKIPKNTDILWVPHYNIPAFYKGKLLVTIHDVFPLAMPQYIDGLHKQVYAKMMFHEATRKAHHIICDSKFTKSELCKYIKVNPKKISISYCGVDDYWSCTDQAEDDLPEKPYILYVGNVKPHKNLQRLIQAFSLMKDIVPHNLIIIGKKNGFITGDSKAADLAEKLGDRVLFTDRISKNELRMYYREAAVFVFPSLYEGFGLPPLEAMAAGCKNIICSDIPVLREVYENSVKYMNPYDIQDIKKCMLEMIQSRSDYSSIQKERLKKFSWDKAALEMKKLLTSIN